MNRKLFICFFLLISGSLSGQYQDYKSTAFWKKYTDALASDIKLDPLLPANTNFHYRIWIIGQVIDILADSTNSILGEITSYAKQYDEMNLGKRTFYSSSLPMDPEKASEIYQMILKTGLTSIPEADAIKGWEKNVGGYTNIIECVDSGEYSFKCYLSPASQGPLEEAIIIQSFLGELKRILQLNRRYKSFSASIPFWCYTKGTIEVICKK